MRKLIADDLLGCECEGIRHADSESEATTPTDPSRTASIESSDDEAANIGFVSATQFDPEPVSPLNTAMLTSDPKDASQGWWL